MRIRSTCAVLWLISSAVWGPACARTPAGPVHTQRGGAARAAATTIAVPLTAATAAAVAPAAVREDLLPPWTLTASDGSGLVLTRVDAKAVIEGPLAFTELHLYFQNGEDRVREGTFQITLPSRAAISRFAMEHAGRWMEAEVVPKLVARRAYDDFLHRRQDPALLEKAAGNQFTAKVFPIAARAEKHLVISYSQELPSPRYVLPLRGLPRIERVEVELVTAGGDGKRVTQRLAEQRWQPDRDFAAAAPAAGFAVGAGELVAARVELAGGAAGAGGAGAGADVPEGITLLVDTSASRALGFHAYTGKVRGLIDGVRAKWGDALPLEVIAFDQDAELVFEGRADGFGDAEVRKLLERGAAGASDLGQALAWLGGRNKAKAQARVVVVGDGVLTAGIEGKELAARAQALGAAGARRLDVVLSGGLRDERAAAQLVRAGLARAGAVLDLDTGAGAGAVAAALGEAVATDIAIEVPGAAWWYPRKVASARAGESVIVYARLPRAAASVEIVAGGRRRALPVRAAAAPLLERAAAGAELAELEARLPSLAGDDALALRAAIAKRSVAARVLSSETSLLVLESDGDYARYGIDRKALADVLVVGPSGVAWLRRGELAPILPRPASQVAAAPEEPARPGERRPELPRERVTERVIERVIERPPPAGAPGEPTVDVDRDGILDVADRCPSEPEAANGFEDDDGCPDRGRVVVTSTAIEILDNVYFEAERATIQPRSYPILDAVAASMLGNPDIALVEVQGHTDERGDARGNLELSDRRAAAVKQYLVGRGVAAQRLVTQGYGETQPIDPAHTPAAWAKNRRAAFLILRRGSEDPAAARAVRPAQPAPQTGQPAPQTPPPAPVKPPPPPPPVTGELAAIQDAIAVRDLDGALTRARDWHARAPGDVLALIGLGEALEARRADATAARVYGSIIDLFPGRADMRRFAGERLARVGARLLDGGLPGARELAIDTFRRAVADRPDHLTGHRLLAYALIRAGRPADAFAAIVTGLEQTYPAGRHAGGPRVLGEDAAMIGAAYAAAVPAQRAEIARVLGKHRLAPATRPSTRFVLYWETDANDVDFHIEDARGGHAFYSQPKLASGGELYADVTTGYGPECFAIAGAPQAGPYRLSLEYYAQGPMGYGMGLLQIQRFDPRRGFSFDDRPYVIMTSRAKVDLGTYRP
ncbi:MAG TPA: OmpA family protein [Kofleriaceae bacterium]|nr:OmpA family protein [Kofleriaceae bacterium]